MPADKLTDGQRSLVYALVAAAAAHRVYGARNGVAAGDGEPAHLTTPVREADAQLLGDRTAAALSLENLMPAWWLLTMPADHRDAVHDLVHNPATPDHVRAFAVLAGVCTCRA